MRKWMLIILGMAAASVMASGHCHDHAQMGPSREREIRIHKMERGDHNCPMKCGMGGGLGLGHGQWWENPGVVEKLALTESQSKQIDNLVLKHRKALIKLEADIKIAAMDLGNLIEDNAPEADIRKKAKELGQLRERIQEMRIDHLLAVRKVLTAEQQQKLKDLKIKQPKHSGGCHKGQPMLER